MSCDEFRSFIDTDLMPWEIPQTKRIEAMIHAENCRECMLVAMKIASHVHPPVEVEEKIDKIIEYDRAFMKQRSTYTNN